MNQIFHTKLIWRVYKIHDGRLKRRNCGFSKSHDAKCVEDWIENEFFVQSWTDELWFSPLCDSSDTLCLPLNIVTKEIGEPCCHDENLSKKSFGSSNYTYFPILLLKISWSNREKCQKNGGKLKWWSKDFSNWHRLSSKGKPVFPSFFEISDRPNVLLFFFSNIYLLIWKKMTLILFVHFTSYRKFMWKKREKLKWSWANQQKLSINSIHTMNWRRNTSTVITKSFQI